MRALFLSIPDPDIVCALAPEELAGKVLLLLPAEQNHNGEFSPYNLENELNAFLPGREDQTYPQQRKADVALALREAFAWLYAQGLIVPAVGTDATWMVLSRRARHFKGVNDFDAYRKSRAIRREALHPRIAAKVWEAFVRGAYDVAVFEAMKAVEVYVRAASKLPSKMIGTDLMRSAFNPTTGPLTDMSAEIAEREARSALFAGAIGAYKNPISHREVDLDDPEAALEIIGLANHLLRIVDGLAAP